MNLSADSQVILLLCSQLRISAAASPKPFTLRDWNPLAAKLHASELKRPGALLDTSAKDLKKLLDLTDDEIVRIQCLLERGGALAIEMERLESVGIWVVTRADDSYPDRLRERLRTGAPAVLFGAGPVQLVGRAGLAIVGSRDVDEAGQAASAYAGQACANAGWIVYSGAARGVDEIAMKACIDHGGQAVGLLADSLEKATRIPANRQALSDGNLTLLTPYSPNSPFSVGTAMGRNKLIYALADYALVVASEAETGGTWAGATDALKSGQTPVFVRNGEGVPKGNKKLLQQGGIAFPFPFPEKEVLSEWMAAQAGTVQGRLF